MGMSNPAKSRPRRQHIVESSIGIQRHRRQRIAVRPGDAGCSVSADFPRVVEHQTRCCGGTSSSEHANLVRVGSCIEVAAHKYRVALVGRCGNELGKLADLRLAHNARSERVVQHHCEELDQPPVTFNRRGQHLSDPRIILSSQLAPFDERQRPAGDQSDARNPPCRAPTRRRTSDIRRPAARQRAGPALSRRSTRTRLSRQCRDWPRPTNLRSPLVAPAIARSGPIRSKSPTRRLDSTTGP